MKTPAKTKIFIVEDEMVFQEMLTFYLRDKLGYQVEAFTNGEEAILNLYKNPAIVLLDYNLLNQNGLEVLKDIKSINPDIHVLLVSGQKNIPVAVDVLKYGAFDYVVKNDNVYEAIAEKVKDMLRISEAFEVRKRKKVAMVMAFSVTLLIISTLGILKLFY
jgi:DNA-binding NtrC family response regulator